MGSQSDLNIMREAAEFLEEMKIPFELTVVSAHRTPQRMVDYASSARLRGLKVIVAGAGGAAHLPGMVASLTSLPVIGVPIKSSNSIVHTACLEHRQRHHGACSHIARGRHIRARHAASH